MWACTSDGGEVEFGFNFNEAKYSAMGKTAGPIGVFFLGGREEGRWGGVGRMQNTGRVKM